MWTVITRIFGGQSNDQVVVPHSGGGHGELLEEHRLPQPTQTQVEAASEVADTTTLTPMGEMDDSYDTRQARQRASVKWLLSKAFNNKVPPNLKEPFYRDHENQEHLKPQILGALSTAELYCLALGNIYSDPNYHNLNHWAILQTLARKGVYVNEPTDSQLTETTLIQTNPLRMTAHMAVIESVMTLYAREVVSSDRVMAAVQRFVWNATMPTPLTPSPPANHEDGLMLWVNESVRALLRKIKLELGESNDAKVTGTQNGGGEVRLPDIPSVQELRDLCDGVALAALISYYCPEELPWAEIRTGARLPSVAGSLHNLGLVQAFCARCMPATVFHMLPEDVTYMRESMKQNLVVFLADMFNLLEIHPLQCVRYPGMDKISTVPPPRSAAATLSTPMQQLLRKSHIHSSVSEMSEDSLYRPVSSTAPSTVVPSPTSEHQDNSFVVHRGRNVPTLSSMQQHGYVDTDSGNGSVTPPVRGGSASNGDSRVAGKPSNWEENKKSSFAGRRSRRNSTSDDSQLTIENFGGSQDNLNFIGRNPDKEVGAHVGRRISAPAMPSSPIIIQPSPVRSSIQDARGSLQLGYGDDGDSTSDAPQPAYRNIQTNPQPQQPPSIHNGYPTGGGGGSASGGLRRQMSSDDIGGGGRSGYERQLSGKGVMMELMDDGAGMVGVGSVDARRMGGVQLVYMQHNNSDDPTDQYQASSSPSKTSFLARSNSNSNGGAPDRKTTTFATLPSSTTTWQQLQQQGGSGGGGGGDGIDQQYMHQHPQGGVMSRSDEGSAGGVNYSGAGGGSGAAQLNDIRLKLEEKRRDIENTKRRYEMDANRQRQKVGKAAFLQAVTNKDTPDHMDRKWMEQNGSYGDRRMSEMENMEKYQHSISQMNSSLVDMQADIQRLANQHNQMQMAQLAQKQHQQMYQQPSPQQPNYHPAQMHQYQSPYSSQYNTQSGAGIYNPLQSSASAPHIPHSLYQQQQQQQHRTDPQSQFFLHSGGTTAGPQHQPPVAVAPVVPQRRTWAQQPPSHLQHHQPQLADVYPQQQSQQPEMRTWGSKPHLSGSPSAGSGGGFMLHDSAGDRYSNLDSNRYTNGNTPTNTTTGFSLSSKHSFNSSSASPSNPPPLTANNSSVQSTPGASPQHQRQHRQLSQLMAGATSTSQPVSLQQMVDNVPPQRPERRSSSSTVMHAPIPAPSVDDMEPQDISFIAGVGGGGGHQGEGDGLSDGLSRLNITSGTRTYRIPSPTRPFLSRGSSHYASPPASTSMDSSSDPPSTSADTSATKGFYISFDDEQPPKRPKPPLRTKKMISAGPGGSLGGGGGGSDKKLREQQEDEKEMYEREREYQDKMERRRLLERELDEERAKRDMHDDQRQRELLGQMGQRHRDTTSQDRERDRVNAASSIIIGNELTNPNPEVLDELERKKEKILMLSLQRRQQQEETKDRKEAEACARRERDKAKEDERARKREEQAQRRAVILEQYKLKKAIEEAEREGKDIDKGMLSSLKPTLKMRPKPSTGRPRPKTIHIDSGSVEMAEGMLQPSRGKKGSTSNLTASSSYNPSSMKRDYYRGSQDSLASTGLIYKDSPDDSRGMSPSSTSAGTGHQTLGRRSSYKTSRDPSPAQTRGRPKYSTYQNFKGRKSNSLMNLYGSSTDQDSIAYRYGDTDSGLGRATPPRRAASPGMGGPAAMRHLPSPSGPGSLPGGLMTKQRRLFDDGSSDISSNASSMMDYNGPRLYKQPTTKSNRGIMLNAVEYCVFPGIVNKEAKSRVLEEMSRSECKHFLILFRDAGCQFRALYSYCPDREDITKLYGTGPKQVNDRMFDKFFKYNSGGKCFSQVHTKHLTVTIDAFTIHNSLWQGKKVNLPNKKDMALVI